LNYTLASNAHTAASFSVELVPPSARFVVNEAQPKYVLAATVGFHVARHVTFSAVASAASSHEVGFNRTTPSATVRTAYDFGTKTQVSADLGTRIVQLHTVAQSYGDIAVNERLRKNLTFAVGLGTTFNPVSNAKAHYLASGFNLELR
jgi:opacity protein-like surface antigen